jgi:hypothetical protein
MTLSGSSSQCRTALQMLHMLLQQQQQQMKTARYETVAQGVLTPRLHKAVCMWLVH